MVGMHQQPALRMNKEGFVRSAFEIDRDAMRMAHHHVVGGGLARAVDGLHGHGEVILLQHLAANDGERHAERAVIPIGFEVVAADRDAGGVEAGACQPARFGECQDIRPITALDLQHDCGFGAFGLPVPVLRMDELSVARNLRHHEDACAAIRHEIVQPLFTPAGKLQDFGARVDEQDGRQLRADRLGDTAHFLDILRTVFFDRTGEAVDNRFEVAGLEARGPDLVLVMLYTLADAVARLFSILLTALEWRTRNFDERAGERKSHDSRSSPIE
ncbi:hypothetical protein AGR13a_Lc110032 [Agrobacterium genomosp. 13 str. CFBP 6927]|uniref:Uncharacterized protein n=1 Tax=Agrobacterium genomosp. 13 str. CFBP 6927 TaxID=1183428 RepID=A0ABM9VJ72_9HYPH|nr:hypothetical protein AGR13a_Lc110032 [Agrobacterium genomosp. 13 str. CFBP 6927]